MDNVFFEIKSRLSMPEVARFYGLEVNRSGMACCPFHDDKNQQGFCDGLFVESLQKIDYIEYLQDVLTRGSEEDKRDLYENGKAEIETIRKRLDSLSERQTTIRRAI